MTEKDAVEVMPRVQSLHAQLYDSPLDSMLWRLQDANTDPNPNPNPNPNANLNLNPNLNPNPNPNPNLNPNPNPNPSPNPNPNPRMPTARRCGTAALSTTRLRPSWARASTSSTCCSATPTARSSPASRTCRSCCT